MLSVGLGGRGWRWRITMGGRDTCWGWGCLNEMGWWEDGIALWALGIAVEVYTDTPEMYKYRAQW